MSIHTHSTASAEFPDAPAMSLRSNTVDLGELYGLVNSDGAFQPEFGFGDVLHFSTKEKPAVGDIVAIWMRPEFVEPGRSQVFIYRLKIAPPAELTFPYDDQPRSEVRPVVILENGTSPELGGGGRIGSILCSKILAMHRMTAVIYADSETAA